MNPNRYHRNPLQGCPAFMSGQAATEVLLVLCLIVMALVMLPDSAIERVLVAVEGRHQAILKYVGAP
jgi:hypothetical protein